MPVQSTAGAQRNFQNVQFVLGKSLACHRFPLSMTQTEWPFSASLRAATLPPKPEPITMWS
jgi:hypothetical protein